MTMRSQKEIEKAMHKRAESREPISSYLPLIQIELLLDIRELLKRQESPKFKVRGKIPPFNDFPDIK